MNNFCYHGTESNYETNMNIRWVRKYSFWYEILWNNKTKAKAKEGEVKYHTDNDNNVYQSDV